jgi:hypothetical protein
MNIHKTARVKEEDIPDIETIIAYIQALKLFDSENKIEPEFSRHIANLPSERSLRRDHSIEEVKFIFETVNFLWEKVTGKDIVSQQDYHSAPERLLGNYWLLKNGILLSGVNHFTIVKENTALIETMLNLNGFTLQHYLASKPDPLIGYMLRNGAIRVFIDKDNNGFFQMTDDTYGRWGKKKIKGFDLKSKVVKLIDTKVEFKGWCCGIPIKL